MQQIADWLQNIGLGQYAQRFAENDITFAILPHLTDQDLKELGVTSLGHRRQLLLAIAEISSVQKDPTPPPSAAPHDTAERRQVTVLFSDLVGSTALSARMDPEDLREVIAAYKRCVVETVRRFGGFVAQFLGDGVLVYFGYPEAHEDDAERAVRTGLELAAAVSALKTPALLQTRIGIATGLVVVGDLTVSGEAPEHGILGETPNLAARLQGIAEPNTVVIAESTRKLLGTLFELEDLGAKDLKGIAGPVRAWVAMRASSVESRFEALHAAGLTALVGREEETELLLRRWSRAKSGEGQVVLISGEAGIGKSRLTAALLEAVGPEPHTRLRYFCSPQHTDSAFYPIIGQMERAAGLLYDDTPQQKLDKLDALLAQTSTSIEDVVLIAEMLSLPNDGRYPALELMPQQRRQKTMEALTAQIETLSRQKPVLMIFEDAHWAEPTSLEVFGRLVDRIRRLRVLLLVTFRQEFDAPWVGRPYVTALIINRLTERDVSAMIDRIVGNKRLPASIRQDIIERTDGIPLFVEEMTKAVLEAGSEVAAERPVAAVPIPALAVPASLHASLMARLDRLGGQVRELAQIAAAIGREFSHALLALVVRQPEAELGSALDRLIAAGLLFRRGVPPHATYLFKHALVQDAAYGTLLREPRRTLHALIAETLESSFPAIAENQPEVLAHHCTEAGLIEKAAGLWGKAGQRSLARSAFIEAMQQITRALTQISTLSATPALRRQQIKFQIALAHALMHTKGMAAPETTTAIEEAQVLIKRAEDLGEPSDPLLLFRILEGFWLAHYAAFNGDAMRELAAQFLALADKQEAITPFIMGHRLMGVPLMWTGNFAEARSHFDRAIELCDDAERPLATGIGKDYWVHVLSERSLTLWSLGYPDTALADVRHAVRDARDLGRGLGFAGAITSIVFILCGNYAAADAQLDEALAWADEKSSVFWKAFVTRPKGWVLALIGKTSDAVEMITSGSAAFRSTGSTVFVPTYLSELAAAYADIGQFDNAWRCIDEATVAIETTKETWFEAETNRIAGQIALLSPEPNAAKAQAYFERALQTARQQNAKSWELRAAMSMAQLLRDQGKPQQARELLAPVYGWFTEGFDTRDLKEAKALLEEMSS